MEYMSALRYSGGRRCQLGSAVLDGPSFSYRQASRAQLSEGCQAAPALAFLM